MPLAIKWSSFKKDNVLEESNAYGVYELGDSEGNILYVGEGHVRDRLESHFGIGNDPIPGAGLYRIEYTGSKERAEQREHAEIRAFQHKHGDCPKFNDRLG